ncbi:hypothetical protein OsI_37969 [Oryza sativa Indica Group]|uniref:Uncharacterized protein n=1 Tax=Oryza sativa subsp. indica TaxID=39946 RepID=B8BP35_ORYSI|nr:hypothetical protein OsI_37969 [Oryza sativa Indica Group]
MEEDPTGVRAALRIVRRAFGMVCDQWSSLLPVVVGIFLLNLALTLFMVVNLASPLADLHVMRPFYDIDQANLTAGVTTAAADTVTCSMVAAPGGGAHGHGAASPMWELHLTGELFWSLSMAVAMFSFSRLSVHVVNVEEPEGMEVLQHARTWRDYCSIALAVLGWQTISYYAFGAMQAVDREDLLREFDAIFGCGYLLVIVVVSRENIHGFLAIEKAWGLVFQRFKVVSCISIGFLITLASMDHIYNKEIKTGLSQYHARKAILSSEAVKEDTTAEILTFSLVAALLDVIMQLVVCPVILVLYRDLNPIHAVLIIHVAFHYRYFTLDNL